MFVYLEAARKFHANRLVKIEVAFVRPTIVEALRQTRSETQVKEIETRFFGELRKRIEEDAENYDIELVMHLIHVRKN